MDSLYKYKDHCVVRMLLVKKFNLYLFVTMLWKESNCCDILLPILFHSWRKNRFLLSGF